MLLLSIGVFILHMYVCICMMMSMYASNVTCMWMMMIMVKVCLTVLDAKCGATMAPKRKDRIMWVTTDWVSHSVCVWEQDRVWLLFPANVWALHLLWRQNKLHVVYWQTSILVITIEIFFQLFITFDVFKIDNILKYCLW